MDISGFSDEDIIRLQTMIRAYETGKLFHTPNDSPTGDNAPIETYIVGVSSPIAAISSGVPGTGTGELYDDSTGTLVDTGISVNVINVSSVPVPNSYCPAIRDPYSGNYVAIPVPPTLQIFNSSPFDVNINPAYTLEVMLTHGLKLSQGFLTTDAILDVNYASISTDGTVSQVAQSFKGAKTFTNLTTTEGLQGTTDDSTYFNRFDFNAWIYKTTSARPTLVLSGNQTPETLATFQASTKQGCWIDYIRPIAITGTPGYMNFVTMADGNIARATLTGLGSGGTSYFVLGGEDTVGTGATHRYCIIDTGGSVAQGQHGTDWIGNVFKGGICTSVATTAPATIGGGTF